VYPANELVTTAKELGTTKRVTLQEVYRGLAPEFEGEIASDAEFLHGVPRIEGTRLSVWRILYSVAEGQSLDDIAEEHGIVTRHVVAAIQFAGATLRTLPETEARARYDRRVFSGDEVVGSIDVANTAAQSISVR
jgi:uncharacterized protein (DUF433 family)